MKSAALGASTPLSPAAQATLNKHLPKLQSKRLAQPQLNTKPLAETIDVGCLTDICSYDNLPEVEIFSLLEEQIPKYKIRSDFLTDFSGYCNRDWYISAPCLEIPTEGLGLTKDQTRETLNYFLLCGNRVSQMTRAYDDIEAVTRLLEEKEKDLELTVQIGKELLTQNNTLENRIAELEADLKSSNEDRTQLVHELHKKIELISVLTTDVEDNSDNETPTTSKSVTLDLLQRKINSLQDENKTLKLETTQLVCQTDAVEAHEKQLMDEITTQLNEAHEQYNHLNYELERQREENRLQHEQIVSLTARLSEAEMRLHQLTHDNDEHITLLNITKENQNSLAMELVEFKQRYQEVLVLLQETQDQLRKYRKKSMPQARNTTLLSSVNYNIHSDSLQSELMESSIYSEMSMDSGISNDTNRLATIPHLYVNKGDNACDDSKIAENSLGFCSNLSGYSNSNNNSNSNNYNNNNNNNNAASPFKGVFDTIKIANKNCRNVPLYGALPANNTGGSSLISNALFHKQLSNSSASSTFYESGMGMKSLSRESLISHCENEYCPTQPAGVPGVPGAKELEAALKRLTPIEVMARRAMLSCSLDNTYTDGYDDNKSTSLDPLGIRTPESIMSTGSSGICSSAYMSSSINKPMINQWRLPQKLQIVKPLEGSHTLHNWLRLATPTLNAVLEDRPGITIRGGRGMDSLGLQTYTLSDVEEDVTEDLPGKQFENSACTFTYVTSTVMHPDDGFKTDLSFLTQSQVTSRMASASTSRQPSCPPTPRPGISRKNSCSTFSVNLGLASMLNERGIKAVTPSALNTPAGPNFSPTVTPCNSPEGTPVRSMSPEPLFSLLTSGADLIRRKFIGRTDATTNKQKQQQQKIMLNRLERRALRSLRLVERCEKIGLENIITTQSSALLLASGIANRSISPMAQLTSLKNLQSPKNCVVNDLHFDRHQIKDVLQRGLNTKNATTNANANALPERIETITATETTTTKALPGESDALWKRRIEFSDTEVNVEMDNDALSAMTSRDAMMMISTNKEENTSDVENVRIKQMQRQRSRHNMVIMKNGQRPDLGTLTNLRVRTDLGRVSPMFNAADNNANKRSQDNDNDNEDNQQTLTQTFVGTMSSLIFGRKGGWF